MRTKKSWVLGLLLAGWLSLVAAAPVAMRVEVEPLRLVGDTTEVAVIVQVSPEDRARIGTNAILRVELDGGAVSSGSPMRAVRLEDDGSTRVVVAWPPGEHHLKVEIEDPNREDTGLWVGTVRIPDLSPEAFVEEVRQPDPAPTPDSTEPPPVLAPAPVPAPVPNPTEPEPAPVPVPEIPERMTEEIPVEIERAEAEPELSIVEDRTEPPQIEEPAEAAEELPLVEPLRADPSPQTAEPEVTAPRQEAAPAMVPVSAELAARYEEWGSGDPEIREFSMIVTRGREPATDLDSTDFKLRVGGSQVAVESLGDAGNAPLLLGLAIDVAAEEIDAWSGMQGSLSPIVERAGGGRGRLFVATHSAVGTWDAEPDARGRGTGPQSSNNVARLVMASMERFDGMHGRTFLIVLTDGRNEPSKDEWREVTEAAGEDGVPILVVALWDGDFSDKTRKNLAKLVDVSGGSLFLVQGRSQLDSAADRFGRYLDGGYSIRFKTPGEDRQTPTAISVTATDKDLEVSAPKSIR